MPKFSFWVPEGALFASVTMLMDAFAIANLWQRAFNDDEEEPLFRSEILTLDGAPVNAMGDIPVLRSSVATWSRATSARSTSS